jgi:hypothetical protein
LVREVPQLTGADLTACTTDPNYTLSTNSPPGAWCDVTGAAAIQAFACASGQGAVRFLGAATTQGAGAAIYLRCH